MDQISLADLLEVENGVEGLNLWNGVTALNLALAIPFVVYVGSGVGGIKLAWGPRLRPINLDRESPPQSRIPQMKR